MMNMNRVRHLMVAGLVSTTVGVAGGIATTASANAAGPTNPHGTNNVGDNNQGQGASGEVGNMGGCIHTQAGLVSLSQSPFFTVACFVPPPG